jgi:NTE family protein
MTFRMRTDKQKPSRQQPTVAVVIGSGGIKTFGAVALLEWLDDAGIVPDLLLGSSGGAFMAGLWATGYEPAKMTDLIPELMPPEFFSQIDYGVLWGIPGLPLKRFGLDHALLKPDSMHKAFARLFGDTRLEDLRPKTLIQVTDFHTGEGFVLEAGRLADAVYASGAAYPILPMLQLDNRWLMDGAYTSPCPVLEAVRRQVDVIIAVTFETTFASLAPGVLPLFQRTQFLCTSTLMRSQMTTAINLHHHELIHLNLSFDQPIEMWNFDAIPLILQTGQQVVAAQKHNILAAIQSFAMTA